MPEWLDELLTELSKFPEIVEVAAADESGVFLTGTNNDKPDEFAAILAFLGRAAVSTGEIMGLESMRYVSVIGAKDRLLVYRVQETLIGLRLTSGAIISKMEGKLDAIVERAIYSSMDE